MLPPVWATCLYRGFSACIHIYVQYVEFRCSSLTKHSITYVDPISSAGLLIIAYKLKYPFQGLQQVTVLRHYIFSCIYINSSRVILVILYRECQKYPVTCRNNQNLTSEAWGGSEHTPNQNQKQPGLGVLPLGFIHSQHMYSSISYYNLPMGVLQGIP